MALPEIQRLDAPRCHLRPVDERDLPDLMVVNGDPEVCRFLPYAPWQGPADARAWLERMRGQEAAGGARQLVLALNGDGRAIGTVLLFRHDAGSARAELGYALARAHWGWGLAREGLGALIAHALGPLGLRRLEAEVDPRNQRSWQLLENLGFVREGLARERWVNHGVPCSVYGYGLLRDDLAPR